MSKGKERPRFRDLGYPVGSLPCGRYNAITDVPGVLVGHKTLIEGEGPLVRGKGPVRTGVSVILPHAGNVFLHKVPAAVIAINGYGKACGFEQVRELGVIESPIALTNTLNVGLVLDALVQDAIRQNPEIGVSTSTVNIVVGETNDGYLNDIQGRHVRAEHVFSALQNASSSPVEEGSVGAGTGTCCFGWKGGIGTSSRVLPEASGGYILGALVQANFGRPQELMILGVPAGRLLEHDKRAESAELKEDSAGSVMVVLATDAPLSSRQLGRLCKRAAAGLARLGSSFGHSSGDFVIAFSTGQLVKQNPESMVGQAIRLEDEAAAMAGLFPAVADSVEEAVLNALCCADTMTGRDGHTAAGLPLERVVKMLRRARG